MLSRWWYHHLLNAYLTAAAVKDYEQIKTPFPIKFIEGISKFEELPKDRQPRILIIDDSMDEVANSPDVADMYAKYSHH